MKNRDIIRKIQHNHSLEWYREQFHTPEGGHSCEFAGFYANDASPIFEGDILAFGEYNLAVVFQKGEFVGKFKEEIDDDDIPGFIIRHEAHNFEIVGNVFENPELVSSNTLLPKKS